MEHSEVSVCCFILPKELALKTKGIYSSGSPHIKNNGQVFIKTLFQIHNSSFLRGGFRGGGHQARVPLFLLVQIFLSPIFALMPVSASYQSTCRSKMSILCVCVCVCVCVTVKTQFDNTSTCK